MAKPSRPLPPLSSQDVARFWSRVDVRGPDECWPWKACRNPDGYGAYCIHGENYSTNRVALFIVSGEDPAALLACHTCDNPPCCNPAHLFKGTEKDNAQDREHKGRSNPPLGSDHGAAKFSPEQIYEIVEMWNLGHTQRAIAAHFGAWQFSISLIIRGKAYKAELSDAIKKLGHPVKDFKRRPWASGKPAKHLHIGMP